MKKLTFKKIFAKHAPKPPKTLNFAESNFFIKGVFVYKDNKFIYIDIGLKNYIKVPINFCFSHKNEFKLNTKILFAKTGKIITLKKETPKNKISVTSSQNKQAITNLNFISCK